MRIFLDTEFTNLVKDPGLISIGLVDEKGEQTFYAELLDTYQFSTCSDFVRQSVLPLLEGGGAVMSYRRLSFRLRNWLEAFGEPVKLATDSPSFDWAQIQELFSPPGFWPANLEHQPLPLTATYLMDFDKYAAAVEREFASGGLRRHHAMDDAEAHRRGFLAAGSTVSDTPMARGRFTV